MIVPIILALICLAMTVASVSLYLRGREKVGRERVMQRLGQRAPEEAAVSPWLIKLEHGLMRAGLGPANKNLLLWVSIWVIGMLFGGLIVGWVGFMVMLLLPPVCVRIYVSFRYRRRVRRMVEQLPSMLDHAVRSLKSGRTLNDALLGAVDVISDPLQEAMSRVRRNVQLGVPLADAIQDLADFYSQDELRLLAVGLKINQRYGGNASELLENLIKLIREREQGARQLRALTGETRMTAYVLAALPVGMIGYFLVANPVYLLRMWNDPGGHNLLMAAVGLQILGCVALWRMLRSI